MNGKINFFSLNKKSDWEKGQAENLEFADHGILLRKTERYGVYRIIHPGGNEITGRIIDFAVDKYGLLYFLDEHDNIWNYDYHNDNKNLLLSASNGMFSNHAVIAAGEGAIFLADRAGEARLWAFAMSNGQLLWRFDKFWESSNYCWFPLDVSVAPNGCILVLAVLRRADTQEWEMDIDAGEQLGVIRLDAGGSVLEIYSKLDFACAPEGTTAGGTGSIQDRDHGGGGRSLAISATSNNGFCILDGRRMLYIFGEKGELQNYWYLEFMTHPTGVCVDSEDYIYIGDGSQLAKSDEDGRHIHRFSAQGEFLGYLENFQGKTGKVLLDAWNRLYIWNREANSLHIMAMKTVVEKNQLEGATRGTFISAALDSKAMELQWHRITMDVLIPEDTQIELSYLAADRKEFLIDGHYINLDDFIKDEQVAMEEKLLALAPFWSKPLVNPRDCLLQAQGRFLWLKIEFNGSEWRSPCLKKLRVYFPRMSYLEYLPAVYQDDKESRDFLERFLSLFSSLILDMEEEIYNISRLFDARVVSGPFLKWLAGWLDIAVDESWDEGALRQLIIKAPELYRMRGTRQGIKEILDIYAGERPLIVEHFQYKYLQEDVELKDLMTRLYGQDPYCFHVLLKQEHVPTAAKYEGIQKILDDEKPAFTEARLIVLQPWIYMDMHTYLGINTYLSELSLLRLDKNSSIPYSSLLTNADRYNRMELDAQIE
ncbi:MAG: phage tail protein [Syntrophomonadaceae bacterium]|nr:phage tail protein [Syntrophomonadaceae bacterium]